jgi:hypothetical protein
LLLVDYFARCFAAFRLACSIKASNAAIETRVFCAYLDPVQPSRMKSMVLRFASSGKRKVA